METDTPHEEPYLYIITNPIYEAQNIYKVGFHTGPIKQLESRYQTYFGKPIIRFIIKARMNDEKIVHKLLKPFRLGKSELFKLPLEQLYVTILSHFSSQLSSSQNKNLCNIEQKSIINQLSDKLSSLFIKKEIEVKPLVPPIDQSVIERFNQTRSRSGRKSSNELSKAELLTLANKLGLKVDPSMTTRQIKEKIVAHVDIEFPMFCGLLKIDEKKITPKDPDGK